jgi:membrane-associated phospholipid phosphatase
MVRRTDGSRAASPNAGEVMDARRALRSRLAEANRIDRAVYAAVATTPTPLLDRAMRRLSVAANYSRLWIGSSVLLAATAGPRGRLAAKSGLASVAASSALANLIVKPVGNRRRPDRGGDEVPPARQIAMPVSRSFPSGHAASAFACASAISRVLPAASVPLRCLAALVAYSRVHTGVHYPGDAIAEAVGGAVIADLVTARVVRNPTSCSG